MPEFHSQNLSDNSSDFIDKSEPSIDTKLVNHLNPSNSTDKETLSDNSADFIDNPKLSIDTKLGNYFNTDKLTHLSEANQEVFDLQTYKKFLSFLKFKEMMDKYNT